MNAIHDLLAAGQADFDAVVEAFDQLPTADTDFMLGRWRGSELKTGNAMDGLLEANGWYGKEFVDADNVHPLLFTNRRGEIIKLEPRRLFAGLGLGLAMRNSKLLPRLFSLFKPLMQTRHSRARLRMTEYRGKLSATMIYDNLPINDVFRKVDDNTVLGAMDLKGMPQPYFFVLRRETSA